MYKTQLYLTLLLLTFTLFSFQSARIYGLQEHFKSLSNWKMIDFGHDKHTSYKIRTSGDKSFMKSESKATATAMVCKTEFDVYETPIIEWRWQVNNIIQKANLHEKKGDDFPLAVYVLFKYDYKSLNYFERITYNTKKALFNGEEPPHSTLRFVWSSYQEGDKKTYTTPYQDSGRNYLVQVGDKNCNKWVLEKENIVEIYKKAFGEAPPEKAIIGFMNDSDNTKESAISYLDYIEVYNE